LALPACSAGCARLLQRASLQETASCGPRVAQIQAQSWVRTRAQSRTQQATQARTKSEIRARADDGERLFRQAQQGNSGGPAFPHDRPGLKG